MLGLSPGNYESLWVNQTTAELETRLVEQATLIDDLFGMLNDEQSTFRPQPCGLLSTFGAPPRTPAFAGQAFAAVAAVV